MVKYSTVYIVIKQKFLKKFPLRAPTHHSFTFKIGLSPSTKICFIRFNEGLLKMMKNTFYFILKALFILEIFEVLSWLFGPVEKTVWLEI